MPAPSGLASIGKTACGCVRSLVPIGAPHSPSRQSHCGCDNDDGRRAIADPEISRLALWARRLAIFALPVAVLAIVIERAGLLEIIPVLVTFGAALALALLAISGAIALRRIWIDGRQGAATPSPA